MQGARVYRYGRRVRQVLLRLKTKGSIMAIWVTGRGDGYHYSDAYGGGSGDGDGVDGNGYSYEAPRIGPVGLCFSTGDGNGVGEAGYFSGDGSSSGMFAPELAGLYPYIRDADDITTVMVGLELVGAV